MLVLGAFSDRGLMAVSIAVALKLRRDKIFWELLLWLRRRFVVALSFNPKIHTVPAPSARYRILYETVYAVKVLHRELLGSHLQIIIVFRSFGCRGECSSDAIAIYAFNHVAAMIEKCARI